MLIAEALTKRYGKRVALADCNLDIPAGRVVGLVGPNGAGKSTLLQLACSLIEPTSGSLRVLGAKPGAGAAHLARVGFVAQDTPVYASLSVADHLRMGAHLNPGWDTVLAQRLVAQAGLSLHQKAGRCSGGQRAQLALTIAAAKRPELLIFDEPAAALDPLARNAFLDNLVNFVAELGASAILSSHLLADVERVCNYLIVLCDGRVQVAGDVSVLLSSHHRILGRVELERLPASEARIQTDHFDGRLYVIVRSSNPMPANSFTVERVGLEELVLAYMARAAGGTPPVSGIAVPERVQQ